MWAQLVNVLLGILVTISPALLNFNELEADNSHIAGPLVTTIAAVAVWEFNRNFRYFNVPVGLWLMAAPFILSFQIPALITGIASGVLVIGCSLIKGKIKKRYGGGWRSLWQKNPLHMRILQNSES